MQKTTGVYGNLQLLLNNYIIEVFIKDFCTLFNSNSLSRNSKLYLNPNKNILTKYIETCKCFEAETKRFMQKIKKVLNFY